MEKPGKVPILILCVEDEAAARTVLVRMLKRRFGSLLVAKDGAEGLALFLQHRPPLVITDIKMPKLDGISMARAIKTECPETRIIITTALGDADLLLSAIEIGVSDYVLKPVTADRLHDAIDKCLQVSALELELRSSKAMTETILEGIGHVFFVLDSEGRFTYLNRKAEDLFRLSRRSLPAEPFLTLFPEFLPERKAFEFAPGTRNGGSFEHFTPSLGLWHEVCTFQLEDGVSAYLQDITERKQAEEKIHELAFIDRLTGLPNRTLFQDRLDHTLARMRRSGERCALLFLDLDYFKTINDSLGHAAGDEVLKEVARRLLGCLRGSDTAARLGGDEFILLLEGFENPETIHAVTRRILVSLAQKISHEDLVLSVTASIGISFFPEDGDSVDDLLKAADTAMYFGKKRGRNTYQFYRREMSAPARSLLLGSALHQAVHNQEFILHYQPQQHLQTRALIGFEALIRWRHPELGVIPPAEFIPQAEDTGFILQLGDWVLRQACRQGRQWLDLNPGPFRMAVNLSSREFWQEDLVDTLASILSDTGLPAECLELELTERMIMPDVDLAIERMRSIADLGVRLTIDDFGTGFSSLAALKRFPIQSLKIDKSFIEALETNPNDAAIVTSVIALAHTMKFAVMAEGIETRGQLEFLLANGCEAGQGNLLCAAIAPEEVETRLQILASGAAGPLVWP